MESYTDLLERCAALVAALNAELGWGLGADEQAVHCRGLQPHIPSDPTEPQLRALVLHYHHDHALVEAMLHAEHSEHDAAWSLWMQQVIAILRNAGMGWSDDVSIDREDLAQVARTELARALPSFHYASRFSTWAHQVIVQSVRRYIRDRQALKRAGRPTSLEHAWVDTLPTSADDCPEAQVHARVLAELVANVLAAQPDQRLARIFQLWALADLRVEEIGRQINLSASHARVLLTRMRAILQEDPIIQAWRDSTFDDMPS
jgi:RNA polymerase sigma factor (sigma-70 family)